MENADADELLTVPEVAAMLKVKRSWVYDSVNSKIGPQLPHVRLGRYIRFQRSAVLEFVQRQRKGYMGFRQNG